MLPPKRVRNIVNYAESELSSLTEVNPQVYGTTRRRTPSASVSPSVSPIPPSVVEISSDGSSTIIEYASERPTSRSSMPPLEPIWPPTPLPDEADSFRAPSPFDVIYQQELEAAYMGALLTSKFFFIYYYFFFFHLVIPYRLLLLFCIGRTTYERIAAYRAFRAQMDQLLGTLSPDDEYTVLPPDRI